MFLRQFILLFLVMIVSAGLACAADLDKGFAKAVAAGDLAMIRTLLDQGIDINAKNKEGETALMLACLEGRTEVARLFIEKGADLHAKDSVGATALLYAAVGGSLDTMKLLIDKGASIDARTDGGETALSISEMNGNKASVEFLQGIKK